MRKAPDSEKEMQETDASLRPRYGQIVLLHGEGLASKVGVGAPELDDQSWLDIVNRNLAGARYTRIERLRIGAVQLAAQPLQGNDQCMTHDGANFGSGQRAGEDPSKPIALDARPVDTDGKYPERCPVWLVRRSEGAPMLLGMPAALDSLGVAEMLEPVLAGEFSVQSVSSGIFTAAPSIIVPGWTQVLATTSPASSYPQVQAMKLA